MSEFRFVSASELRQLAPAEPPWCWQGYLASGGLTLLAGKPKVGKSTLALATAHAFEGRASAFLGRAIEGGAVVYVSEEGAATLAQKLSAGEMRVLTRDLAWPKPDWPALVRGAASEAERVAAKLLVIDTGAYWAGLPPEREKDSGAALAVVRPLLEAARAGLAVLLVLHQRKGGGEDGEGVRGSTAFAGSADVVLELERTTSPRQRALLALSRYPQTPGTLVIEHDATTGSWSVVGEGADRGDARNIADRRALLAALTAGASLTRVELEQEVGSPERQWHGQLEQLIEEGQVRRIGAGRKGDPYRFEMVRSDSAQTPAQHSRRNGHEPGSVSAAHHVVVQQKEPSSASNLEAARCAETGLC